MCSGDWAKSFLIKLALLLGCVVALYGIVFLDSLTNYQNRKTRFIGRADRQEHTITVSGFGKVTGANDIATTNIGYTNVDKDVTTAEANNKRVMDAVLAEAKRLGVADRDLKSNITVNPEYSYTSEKGQELKGYRVTNNLTIKIRDLNKVSEILALAGKYGANQVGGLNFTIDDADALKAQARAKALEDAKAKALTLARNLRVTVTGISNYNEYDTPDYQPVYDDLARNNFVSASPVPAPAAVATGSKDVSVSLSITYTIAE